MLLRIIDCTTDNNAEHDIKVQLEANDFNQSFLIESYSSPINANFHKTLAWYFDDYPKDMAQNKDDSGVIEKVIKFGQYIGDELLGEDYELIKLKEHIESHGYENLQVQIESSRVEFFQELWESLILHESKYLLSAVSQGFVRQFTQPDFPVNYPELEYQLSVPAPQNQFSNLLGEEPVDPNESAVIEETNPLNILYLVTRTENSDLPYSSSNSINQYLQAVSTGEAINFELLQATNWEKLQARLADKGNPVHIIHYDGPVLIENNMANILVQDLTNQQTKISIEKLAKVMTHNQVACLSIDARVYVDDQQPIPASLGLATIAQSAQSQGLGNVIGLSQVTNPWVSGDCFNAIYLQLTKGLTLAQAVVEARKALQSNTEISLMTIKPISFHPWSLITHYGKQSVTYFESEQVLGDDASAQGQAIFHDKLHGFHSSMLPPLLDNISDGQALSIISLLSQKNDTGIGVSITGKSGSGKTHLIHVASLYLAQKQLLDFGFYFDFNSTHYNPDDMLQMIAPLLGLETNQTEQVLQQLTSLNCLFVLDNIDNLLNNNTESSEKLCQFIQSLKDCRHSIVFISSTSISESSLVNQEVSILPLSSVEQKIIAANCLQQQNFSDELLTSFIDSKRWHELLEVSKGNPWLIKKLIPLLKSNKVEQLIEQTSQQINQYDKGTITDLFYQWQWQKLKPGWQQLLLLCSQVNGLLLEMLMTAADQKDEFEPAKKLFQLLDLEQEKFSQALEAWTAAGFLSQFPHGRVVDPGCLSFLESKREKEFENSDIQSVNFAFSQLICEGVKLLSLHVVKQPNGNISNNLLLNRRQWVKHFENLWFGHDYRGFMGVKNAFLQLLQQAKLEAEGKAWTLDLVNRSPSPEPSSNESIEQKLSWLALAASVLTQDAAKDANNIKQAVNQWQDWFESFVTSIDEKQLTLFQQAATFLENYHSLQQDWLNSIFISENTLKIYTQYEAWQRVIMSLKALARYNFMIGETEKTSYFENKILDDIPYENSPPGFKSQQILDIILARLSRSETSSAQALLDQLRESEEAQQLGDMLDGIQSDIDYKNENYEATLPYYCKTWVRALESKQQPQIEQLKLRMIELEQKLGAECFNQYFTQQTPAGTILPKDYIAG